RLELVRNGQDRCGVDAALADGLTVGPGSGHARNEVRVLLAIPLRVGIGRLSADHRDVVVEARVPDAVVLPHKRTGLRELAREIRRRGFRAARRGGTLGPEAGHDEVPAGWGELSTAW